MGIVDSWGNEVVHYTYDAWGNLLGMSGSMAGTLGKLNVLRYRGYVYDDETGLYYLNSRYYNPEWGRFISADSPTIPTISPDSATWDKNLFAYCDNNPVTRKDDGGHFWHLVVGGLIGGAISAATSIGSQLISKGEVDWNKVAIDAGMGAISGVLTASGAGLFGQIAGGALISSANNAAQQVYDNKGFNNFNVVSMLQDGAIGGLCGAISGPGASSVQAGAGGGKQMISLGKGTVKRTWNALTHDGVGAFFKEAGKATRYYWRSTISVSRNLFTVKNLVLHAIS